MSPLVELSISIIWFLYVMHAKRPHILLLLGLPIAFAMFIEGLSKTYG